MIGLDRPDGMVKVYVTECVMTNGQWAELPGYWYSLEHALLDQQRVEYAEGWPTRISEREISHFKAFGITEEEARNV